MRTEQLRNTLKAEPFRPFKIHLADGRSFRVAHPELVSISPDGRSAVVWSSRRACDIIDLMLVTDLELTQESESERAG